MASLTDDERSRLLDSAEADLAGVEAALARLASDTYFVCEDCGAVMDDGWLGESPLSRRCSACAAIG